LLLQADPLHIAAMATIVFLGGILQSTVGFAYAMFAIPLIIWLGVPLYQTIAIVATCSFIQTVLGVRRLHAAVPWRTVLGAIALCLTTTFIGVLVLLSISTLNVGEIKFIVGCIVCGLVGIQISWRIRPSDRVHPGWGVLAFSTSGLLAGMSGMGGPPLVLWVMAQNWSSEKTRAFLFAVFGAMYPVQILLIGLTFGQGVISGVLAGVVLSPSVFVGALIGLSIGNRIPKGVLRQVAFIILLIIGLNSIIPQAVDYLR
jgi:hypothetical protein